MAVSLISSLPSFQISQQGPIRGCAASNYQGLLLPCSLFFVITRGGRLPKDLLFATKPLKNKRGLLLMRSSDYLCCNLMGYPCKIWTARLVKKRGVSCCEQ